MNSTFPPRQGRSSAYFQYFASAAKRKFVLDYAGRLWLHSDTASRLEIESPQIESWSVILI